MDERATARRLRDLRGRVKAARATIPATPGTERALRQDWVRAAHFYARFGITEALLRYGVPKMECPEEADQCSGSYIEPTDARKETLSHEEATLPV
jgi:hypothetical protein